MKRFIKKPPVIITSVILALLISALQFTPPEIIYKLFIRPADASSITELSGVTGKIGKEDINFGNGLDTDTFSVPTYSGSTITLTKVPSLFANVASIIKGKWYVAAMSGDQGNAALTGSLAWVIDTLSTDPATIELPGNQTYSLTTNLAVPETIVLDFMRGAVLGGTANISGDGLKHIQAGGWQIFSTSGTITFPDGSDLKSSWFASFETAITKISTAKVGMEVTEADTIADDTTVNANTSLIWNGQGKILTISTTKTLTINGSFKTSGLYQVFLCNGTGAVLFADGVVRCVHAEYWYTGSGSYHTAINSALGAYPNVELLDKTYTITSPINYVTTNSDFYGMGSASVIQNTTAGSDTIQINGTVGTPLTNVKIHDLKILSTVDSGSDGIQGDYATNIKIFRVYIDTASKAIKLDHSDNASVKDNIITGAEDGIYIDNSNYVKTINNHILSGYGNGSGIVYYTSTNGIIDENTLYDIGYDGIVVNLTSPDAVISTNNISTCGRYGILVDDGSTGSRIIGNKLDTITSTAMAVVESEHIIMGNEIRDCSATAMTIEDSSYSTVIGNRIKNCGTTLAHHGIYAVGMINGVNGNTISGNVIVNVSGESISIDGAVGGAIGNVVTGNTIDTPHRGIVISTATKTKLSKNTITGTGAAEDRIIAQFSKDVIGDLTVSSPVIDLSDAAAQGYLYFPKQAGTVVGASIYFTEGTSADAGIRIRVGSTSVSTKYLWIQVGSSTLVSQTVDTAISWYIGETSEGILYSGWIAADDYIRYWSDGGKTGAGEIIIILEICLYG